MTALAGARVGFIERAHPPRHEGAVVDRIMPLLRAEGALAMRVDADTELHRLDRRPPWDIVALKSGSAAALHLAAAAEAWGIPSVNGAEATRLTRDRLASAVVLQRAGLPVPPSHLAWIGPEHRAGGLEALAGRPLVIKAARSAGGSGIHFTDGGALADTVAALAPGPYVFMERVTGDGDDLKIFVAGAWMKAIRRSFPATTLDAKLGRPIDVPEDAAAAAREAGRVLGLTCYGCDFVCGPSGWQLVDVNAFPGYKGAIGAAEAIVAELRRLAEEAART